MWRLLGQHPQIRASRSKEPYYFAPEYAFGRIARSADEYLALFGEDAGEPWSLEASPLYLYSEGAAKEIERTVPDARIVIMLRDPIELMHSMYMRGMYMAREKDLTFEEALAAESERKRDPRYDMRWFYRDLATFADGVERYLQRFETKVVIFDDFVSRQADVYADLLRFIGADESFEPEPIHVNHTRVARSRFVHRALYNTALRQAARLAFRGRAKRVVRRTLHNINTVTPMRSPLSPDLRLRVFEEQREDLRRVSELIGRDVESLWDPSRSKTASPG